MKRVLIITYYWPPSGGSGVQRWLKFAKYLPEFGWQPVIYTPENPDFAIQDLSLVKDIPANCEVIKHPIWEPYHLFRVLTGRNKKSAANFGATQTKKVSALTHFMYWVRGNLFIPDPRKFWVKPSVKFLSDYLEKHPVDAIVTTGPPHSMHLVGLGVKKRLNIPWIADMRDPWASFDVWRKFYPSRRSLAKQRALEQEVVQTCDKVIMVSPSLSDLFAPFDKTKLALITNGFDTADFETAPATTAEGQQEFRIYHTGLLNDFRNPVELWKALTTLCQQNSEFDKKLRLILIGEVDINIQTFLKQHPVLAKKVEIHKYIPHSQLIAAYSKASLLLLLANNTDNAKAQITGKFFEYLAARKPILAFGPIDSDLNKLVNKHKVGIACAYDDFDKTLASLETFFQQHIAGTPLASTTDIEQFSRKRLTASLVKLLEQLT